MRDEPKKTVSLAGLTRWHLDNWSDAAFKEHIPAVRQALAEAFQRIQAPAHPLPSKED